MLSANATPSPPPVANPFLPRLHWPNRATVSIVVHRLHRDELLRNLQTLGVAAQRQPATQVRLVLIDNSDASELGEALRALAQESGWPDARVLSGHGNVGYGAGHNLAILASADAAHLC